MNTKKSTIIKEFAESKGVNMLKITLSQRMPNEVIGMMMPSVEKGKLMVFDSNEISELKDGDILFFDEIFNGTLKQTLDTLLNFVLDRKLPSGKKVADVMIVAASNPQGLINITPQIKQRFDRYDLKFNNLEFEEYLFEKYGMPSKISNNLCILINKEKFETNDWHYNTPRSIEGALNQIGCDLKSNYDDLLMPFLTQKIILPTPFLTYSEGEEIEYLILLKEIVKQIHNK